MLKWHVSPVPRIAAAGLILGAGLCGTSLANDVWQSGRFAFSDELGGFSIQNVTGTGTKRDPYVIRQTLDTADAEVVVACSHRRHPRIHYGVRLERDRRSLSAPSM